MNLCEISIDPKHSFLFHERRKFSNAMSELFMLSNEAEVITPRGKYDRAIVNEVWDAAEAIPGNDSAIWRRDQYGSMICRSEYGNRASSFGWEVTERSFDRSGASGELHALHIDNF
jgi:hypothetical protein